MMVVIVFKINGLISYVYGKIYILDYNSDRGVKKTLITIDMIDKSVTVSVQ